MSFRRTRILSSIWRRLTQTFRILHRVLLAVWLLLMLAFMIAAVWLHHEFTSVPNVKANSLLSISLKGAVLEGPAFDAVSQRILGEDVQTMRGMVNNLRKAAKDPRITGIVLNMKDGYAMSYGAAQEIREELARFKESGKKLFAYVDSLYPGNYLFAGLADKIFMSPSGIVYFAAFSAEVPYYRALLEKIGVTPEHTYIGKYKTGPQPEMFEQMPEAHREVLDSLLDGYYENFIEQTATNRKVTPEVVKGWVDGGLYTAEDAFDAGIVDRLVYEKDFERALKIELGLIKEDAETPAKTAGAAAETPEKDAAKNDAKQEADNKDEKDDEPELPMVNNSQYARVKVKTPGLYRSGEKIAVIYASGMITSGQSSPIGSETAIIGSDSLSELLKTLQEDEYIKGVILRLNSGGGGVGASDIIRHALEQLREKKPLYVSMSDLAASGGYMISAPADKIFAYPLTITGSIGIYSTKYHFQRLFEWLGIHFTIFERGKNSGIFFGSRPRAPEEQERMEHFLRRHYDKFVAGVAQRRGKTVAEIDAVAQGRVWFGRQALENGLVDELGGLDEAVAAMKKQLKIADADDVELVEYPETEEPFALLWERFINTQMRASLPDALVDAQAEIELFERLARERELAWFPFRVRMDADAIR